MDMLNIAVHIDGENIEKNGTIDTGIMPSPYKKLSPSQLKERGIKGVT
jgi:hypothetical protein